jgi:tetratricopeptide (TPR) repeat protein
MAIDMETQAGKEFNVKYRVTGYPTLLFIDQDGEIVLRSVGAKDVDRFIALAESAIKADDRSDNYAKEYENGKRDYEFMIKFIRSLNKAGKPSAKIAYDYLDEDHNLSNEQKALFIYEAVTSSDSRLFEMLTAGKYKKYIVEHYSQQTYDEKIYDLCWVTVEKGIEYGVEDLIESATKACKKESRIMYPLLETNAELALARKERDAKAYYSAARKKLEITDNEEEQNDFLLEMIELFPGDKDIAGLALKTVERSLEKNDAAENNYTLGRILVSSERFEESIEYLNKALEQAVQTKKHELAREISQWRKLAINRSKS